MIRPAVMHDAADIQRIVNMFAKRGEMLLLSMNDIYERIFEFIIYEEEGIIIGVCALHPMWEDSAEIRSLAVESGRQGQGIGASLVRQQLERAKSLGFKKVFALTYRGDFFAKLGFKVTSMDLLPKKVWTDCLRCVKFPNCDEIAMILDL